MKKNILVILVSTVISLGITELLRNVKVKECLPNADIRRCNADLRRFSNGNLRESAFDLRKSALKNIPLLIRKSVSAEFSVGERLFLIEEKISLKDLPKDINELRLWIPYPASDDFQQISDFKIEAPDKAVLVIDKEYGNKFIYLKTGQKALLRNLPEVTLSFKVLRKELKYPNTSIASRKNLLRFLRTDRLVPVNGEIKKIAQKITQGKSTRLEKVRAIYDHIIEELTYSKDDPTVCGIGDSLLTLQYKKGICTDYHSLFISFVRSLGIPAKFEIGFRLPEDVSESKLNGYHCWAKFYLKDKGWVPVDISEADKHPEKRDYFFGNIDENRIHLTTGRDITLKDAQDAQPLNFVIYPYAEANGIRFPAINIELAFRDLGGGDLENIKN